MTEKSQTERGEGVFDFVIKRDKGRRGQKKLKIVSLL
jgi:hypothetical protein